METESSSIQKTRAKLSIMIPLMFVVVLWIVAFAEWVFDVRLSFLGILPRSVQGLPGILFAPFIHGDLAHLVSNTIPLLVLGMAMIYFYHAIAYRVILLIWLMDGLGVWLLGREAYHIGASGLVYGLASYLFFSGVLRKNSRLLALALAIVFIYGGILWGVLPFISEISWEAHLFGFLAGIFSSVYFLHRGPANDPVPAWMSEPDEEPALAPEEDPAGQPVNEPPLRDEESD